MRMWSHLAAKVGTSKGRRKQWQTTPKNLPKMQRARAIPVAGVVSGSCQNRPKGLDTNDDENNTPRFGYIPYRCSICAPFVILQTSTR
jgi:hypothetical protein